MFRIIALRLFSDCKDYIVRALKKETTYFFYQDYLDIYDEKRNWKGIKKYQSDKAVSDDFFNIDATPSTPKISISAIVGKNGDGKSSLIEAIIRIVNNFAAKSGFVEDQESLVLAKGMYGILYFELNNVLHSIKCEEEIVILDDKETTGNKQDIENNKALFYTIVDNFSIYSYNSTLFAKESDPYNCWINGIFHKNDSYQTPIVLNPMRTDGDFKINRELSLCRQRLMSLYTDAEGFDRQRIINGEKQAEGFAFSLEKESKLFITSLRNYFASHGVWATKSLEAYCNNYEEYIKKINNREIIYSNYYTDNDLLGQKKFFTLFNASVINQYKPLFKKASSIHTEIYHQQTGSYEVKPEVKRYIDSFKIVAQNFISDNKERQQVVDAVDALAKCCGDLNGLELQRVCLIIAIFEKWKANSLINDEELFNQVLTDDDRVPKERKHALMYLVYKTLSIFSQYRPYTDWIDVKSRSFMFFEYPMENDQDLYNAIGKCFSGLFVDGSNETEIRVGFDTLKLRQTLNFLKHDGYLLDRFESAPSSLKDYEFTKYISFDNLTKVISAQKEQFIYEPIALLPPPIYEGDIIICDESNNKLFPMAELSSGELQMLNSIGTYTYHLRNLNYPPTTTGIIRYKYVNLILEEVELYFHPEYQQQYIYRLLEQIRQVHFLNVTAINLMIVTHSPFVLSDIPSNNILYLFKGKPDRGVKKSPFAANISDILKDSFFLSNGFMGEFVRKQIEMLLYYLAPDEETLNNTKLKQRAAQYWNDKKALSFIKQIGDPLVQRALKGMYNERENLKRELNL